MSMLRSVIGSATLAVLLSAAACGDAEVSGGAPETRLATTSTTPTTTSPQDDTTLPPTTQPPATTEPAPSTTSVFMPGCSATGTPEPGPAGVPDAVAATRDLIIRYAVTCDYDSLAALAGGVAGQFTYSFGGGDDPARLWREAEERGDGVLATLVTLLGMSHGTLEAISGDETVPLYFWPAAFGGDATDEQWREVGVLYSPEEIASMKDFGGYIGYRVGITATGDWLFFVAGD